MKNLILIAVLIKPSLTLIAVKINVHKFYQINLKYNNNLEVFYLQTNKPKIQIKALRILIKTIIKIIR